MADNYDNGTPSPDELGAPNDAIRERLAKAMAQVHIPFTDTLAGPVPTPTRGQFWRARWDRVATAVLLIDAPSNGRVHAAVATFDTDLAQDPTHVTPAAVTSLGVDVVVWSDDATDIAICVLDRFMGTLAEKSPTWRTLTAPTRSVNAERPELPASDPRRIFRASLLDDLAVLTNASWAPSEVLRDTDMLASLKPSQIAEALSIPTADALQVKRGSRPLQPAEAAVLAPLVGVPAADLAGTATALPDVVIRAFDEPEFRAQVVELAARRHTPENATRLQAAYEVARPAARATGHRFESEAEIEMWRQRIRQYFAVQFADGEQ